MSVISKHYTFHVSGHVNYKGESVGYSDHVNVVVCIDTTPIEESARSCAANVAELRDTVVSGTILAVEEKNRSAHRIATTMVGGFFNYIRYNIKEAIMRLTTHVPMLLQALRSLATSCKATRMQLQNDYQQITARYANIFDDLHKNLKSSLVALDKPVYELTDLSNKVVLDSALQNLTSTTILTGIEHSSAESAIEVSRIKDATRNMISDGARNIVNNIRLGRQVERILYTGAAPGKHRIFMPVVQLRSLSLDNGEASKNICFPGGFPSACADHLFENVDSISSEDDPFVNVLDSKESLSAIDRFFKTRLSQEVSECEDPAMANRFSAEVLRMWNACA